MKTSLTLLRDLIASRFGRFITQASAWAARASIALMLSRAAISFVEFMATVERVAFDRIFADRMAMRRLFLRNPMDVKSGYTEDGKRVLAKWARACGMFAPVSSNDPIEMARLVGKRDMIALILADLFEDLPDLARFMAEEERRRAEEILAA